MCLESEMGIYPLNVQYFINDTKLFSKNNKKTNKQTNPIWWNRGASVLHKFILLISYKQELKFNEQNLFMPHFSFYNPVNKVGDI